MDASVAAAAAAENAASMANGESRVVDPELREPVISASPKGTDSLMFAGNKNAREGRAAQVQGKHAA